MYNPLFITNTALGGLIYGLELSIGSSEHPNSVILDVNFTENAAEFVIAVDGKKWKEILIKKPFGHLYTYRDSTIVLTGRMPLRSQVFEDVPVSPCCVKLSKPQEAVTDIHVNVKSPLTAKVVNDVLEIGVSASSDRQEVETTGLLTINGLQPDANGNFSIISKTLELSIQCLTPETKPVTI